jgi:glutathione reductase (NADPH)
VLDAHTVRLTATGREVTAEHILIATGAHPFMPAGVPGIEHAITSNEVFDLKTLPASAVVVGGGYIALEFAGIFAGLGVETTLVYRGEQVLRGFDKEMAGKLTTGMEKRGIRIAVNTNVAAIENEGGATTAVLSTGERIAAGVVLYATGRVPNTRGLGLDAAGVALDGMGAVKVDAASRSSVPSIHAVGDVTNRVNLTPVAIREGHAFADTVFGKREVIPDHSMIPTAVFTTPELGTVGLTEEQAVAMHPAVDVYRAEFRPMRNTLAGRDERMVMKILVDAASDRVLGVHVLGDGAGEMAQLLGIPLVMGATKRDFDRTMAVHPTAAEELVTMRTPSVKHRR